MNQHPRDNTKLHRPTIFESPGTEQPVELIELTSTLLPGESARGDYIYFNRSTQKHVQSNIEILAYDRKQANFGVPDEWFEVQFNPEADRHEVVGSKGLTRKAKADGEITAGSSGTVEIWHEDAATGISVTAHLNWSHDSTDIADEQEIWIRWMLDEGTDEGTGSGKPCDTPGRWVVVVGGTKACVKPCKVTSSITARS
ncbi:MAG: hypothetical protein QGF59_05710, partial [Pirellulaceae bacterium]|nr:hypothetical protein [Pirellulaceae bacterium]